MELDIKINKYPNGIVAKFDNRRIFLTKNKDDDNLIIFKTMHPIEDNEVILSPKNKMTYEKTIFKMGRVITQKVIVLSDEAVDILKYLKDNF